MLYGIYNLSGGYLLYFWWNSSFLWKLIKNKQWICKCEKLDLEAQAGSNIRKINNERTLLWVSISELQFLIFAQFIPRQIKNEFHQNVGDTVLLVIICCLKYIVDAMHLPEIGFLKNEIFPKHNYLAQVLSHLTDYKVYQQ